ncbi:chitinase-3-like protein 1 [Ixodes scapularis]|uniref:chitinase-3-like protein 1 n=1 Tax=Ixodes scapularis TaxID=6945 RepID=UPI001A9E1ACF|nr:chitinase-3-like protein 1 [Ixodes scapularis]
MSLSLEDEQWLLQQSRGRSFSAHRDPSVRRCASYTVTTCVAVTILLLGIFLCVVTHDARSADDIRASPVFPVWLRRQRHGPVPILCHLNVGLKYDKENPYRATDLPGNYCSHLVLPLRILFGWDNESVDLTSAFLESKEHMGQIRDAIKKAYPHLKHLISVGDEAHDGKLHFSDAATTNTTAYMIFIVDIVKWVIENHFSGLVLHRVFPVKAQDRKHMVIFLSHLKQILHRHGLLFVITAPYDAGVFKSGSRPGKLGKFLDYVAVITHGLVKAANRSDRVLMPFHHYTHTSKSIEDALETVISSGLPRNKVILTISLTGYMCTLANFMEKNKSIPNWSDATAVRVLSYKEVCNIVRSPNWTFGYDKESEKPYAVRNNLWIGYEDETSVRKLASLLNKKYLGGVLIWDVSNDDYSGQCGVLNPLVKSIFTEVEDTPVEDNTTTLVTRVNGSRVHIAASRIDKVEQTK